MFVGIGEEPNHLLALAPYPNPRVPDLCPTIQYSNMTFHTDEQNVAVLEAL